MSNRKGVFGNKWVSPFREVALALPLFLMAYALLAAPIRSIHSRNQVKYLTYYNSRFEYFILYPKDVLYPQGEAGNGDGQKFMSVHADAVLTVYGRYNALNETLEDLYETASHGGLSDAPKRVVTYRTLSKDWFVVSGCNNKQKFYEKTMMNKDVIRSMEFVYPEQQKSYYDPIVVKIARSFHHSR